MTAPERIWLDWPDANKGDVVYDEPPERDTQHGQTGYIRADLHAAALDLLAKRDAELARKTKALMVAASVLQGELDRSGGEPFSGRWSIPAANWRGTVDEALDFANAALAPAALTEYERKVAQMKEDFPNGI